MFVIVDSFGYVCIILKHNRNRLLYIHGASLSHFYTIVKHKKWLAITQVLLYSFQTCFSCGRTAMLSVFILIV